MGFLLDIAKDIIEDTTSELRNSRNLTRNAGTAIAAGLAGAAMMKGMSNNRPTNRYPRVPQQGYPPVPQRAATQAPPPPVPVRSAAPAVPAAPAAPAAPVFSFYAIIEGTQRGPYNEAQFKRLVDNDLASASTMVWQEGMPEWKPAAQVAMMQHLFSKQLPQQQVQAQSQQAAPAAPAMPQMPQQSAYYVNLNNQMVGPFNTQQLQHFAQTGEFTQQMWVWCEGMPEWKPAGNVAELAKLFGPAMPQMPKV